MTATAAEFVAPWLEDAELDAGMIIKLAAAAEDAAAQLTHTDIAVIDLQPGNGHRYVTVLTHCAQPWMSGTLCVALPDWNKSLLLMADGQHFPGYVDEKLSLGLQHSTVIAVFTTLLGDLLRAP